MRDFLLETDVPTPVAVPGKPFQAEFERVIVGHGADGRRERYVLKGNVYRSTDGRTRKDVEIRGPAGEVDRLTVLQNTPDGTAHMLHHATRAVVSFPVTEAMELNSGFAVAAHDERLGERTIEGLLCHGYRGSRGGDRTITLWVSYELEEALVEENTVNGEEEDSLRLFNIRRGEPDGSLFSSPEDYEKRSLYF